MVDEVRAQREVSGLNRVGRIAMKISIFSCRRWVSAGRWGPPSIKKIPFFWVKIPIFSGFFLFQLCRVSKALPSARQKTLGKDAFADAFFAERCLPSAALGKAFAECKLGFAECPLTGSVHNP